MTASDTATAASVTLPAQVAVKRVRQPKYKAFGAVLQQWRGAREIETVVRLVKAAGVDFNGATLRGWEYGWTGSPDPVRLFALAHVYGRSPGEALIALAEDQRVHVGKLGLGGSGTEESALREMLSGRIKQLEGTIAMYESVMKHVRGLASEIESAAATADKPITRRRSPARRTN